MKQINLKLSDEQYQKLKWFGEKLGLGVNPTIRALIPNVVPPKERIVEEKRISVAESHDLVPVVKSLDRKKLRLLLNDLINKRWAVTLAEEVKRQLIDNEKPYLTVNTYKRLSRWVHPYRQTEREKYVKPRAKAISRLIFGHEIDRVKT